MIWTDLEPLNQKSLKQKLKKQSKSETSKSKIFPVDDSKKRNFNNPSGTGFCWHIFTAFIKLIRIIKWKNFPESRSVQICPYQKGFFGETPDPDFSFDLLYYNDLNSLFVFMENGKICGFTL